MLALNKTKAALQGRLSHFSNITEENNTVISLVNLSRFAGAGNYGKSPQSFTMGADTGKSLKDLRVTGSHAQISFGRLATIGTYTKSVGGWVSIRGYEIFVGHPFGSIPCRINSARANPFSQLPRLTPSRLAASFSCWRSSGAIRIWKVGDRPSPLGVLSLLIVDMYVRNLIVWILLCTYVITAYLPKATPRTVRAVPRRLTKPLTGVTIMAGSQHTQTHPKFTWRFLALSASTRNVIHITAATEREARDQSPAGCVMVFAGRLPVQEVSHA